MCDRLPLIVPKTEKTYLRVLFIVSSRVGFEEFDAFQKIVLECRLNLHQLRLDKVLQNNPKKLLTSSLTQPNIISK